MTAIDVTIEPETVGVQSEVDIALAGVALLKRLRIRADAPTPISMISQISLFTP
jgi:hypothetical protein